MKLIKENIIVKRIMLFGLLLPILIIDVNANNNIRSNDVKLTDFAKVRFTVLRGNKHLNSLYDCVNTRRTGSNRGVMLYHISALIKGRYIYINEDIDNKSNLMRFSRKGEYVDSCVVDSISSQFDIIKRKPYFGMSFSSTAILNRRLETIYRPSSDFLINNITKAGGASGIYHLGRKNLFAWRNSDSTIVIYNTRNLLQDRSIKPEFITTDTISVVKTKHKKWNISNGDKDNTYTINRRGLLKSSKRHVALKEYDRFDIYPILDSRKYIYLNFYNGGKLHKSAIYDKRRGLTHYITDSLNNKKYPLQLINNQLYPLEFHNITKQRSVALQFYPTTFLRENIDSLPDNIKEMVDNLADSDSGILMTVKLK